MAFWRNIFSSRRSRLNRFNRWFDRAVSCITKTIEKLALANQGIEQEMQEIAETRKALAMTEDGLMVAKAKNDQVISNLQQLLAVD